MTGSAPNWEVEGRDWPNRRTSRFVDAGGLRWHVQRAGHGPALLLVHGTAAATHSWRDLAPLLARRFSVTAPDLPGHGFTSRPPAPQLSLPGMAGAVAALLEELGVRPDVCVGHSAGVAVLARLVLDGRIAPRLLISLNGALLPLRNVPSHIAAPIARLLTGSSLVPRMMAWHMASGAPFRRLMAQTGSRLDARGMELYHRLARNSGHVAAALGMMSHWDVRPFEKELPKLVGSVVLVSGAHDRMVSPAEGERVHALLPASRHITLPQVGHLAHEERPQAVADLITELAVEAGVLRA